MNQKEDTNVNDKSRALTKDNVSTNASFRALNLFDEKQLACAEVLMKRLMQSKKGGIDSVADGIAILMRTQDLNIPFSSAIEHIHVINNKTGIDIHIIKTLLLRAGVVWECTKDYTPLYQYTDSYNIYNESQLPSDCVKCLNAKDAIEITKDESNDKIGVYPIQWFTDLKGNIYNELQVSDKCVKAINKQHALKLASEGKFPVIRIPAQPIDYVTEYKFTRYRMINGKEVIQTAISHFSLTEAQQADFFSKDTYVKYARTMIAHRAFTLGARDIASDALMGCMETTELKQINGIDVTTNDFIEISPIEEVSE